MKYYFSNTPAEKVGPVTKPELVRFVQEGAVRETTRIKSFWGSKPAKRVSFLRPVFQNMGANEAKGALTWVKESAADAGPADGSGSFAALYRNECYFSPFWNRSRRFRRSLKITFWLLLFLFAGACAGFVWLFTTLLSKTTLLGVFGNVVFGFAAFFVLFPLAFSVVLCRHAIAKTYADEAAVRAAEDLRRMRILAEEEFKKGAGK
ncbi:MAG: hypothetical protein IJG60_04735 [Thermoguttaceae bacterium]|nr:hypothetical protein [Thermoguttaceae bacterium]